MLRKIMGFLVAALLLGAASSAFADIPMPQGRVILEVSGAIEHGNSTSENGSPIARFDREMLMALPTTRIETHTDFTEGEQVFEGVLLAELLSYVGASGTDLRAIALNDYAAILPAQDVQRYPVLLALLHNGETMPVRTKGPIWIIYPDETSGSARARPHSAKMVWQLSRIVVE